MEEGAMPAMASFALMVSGISSSDKVLVNNEQMLWSGRTQSAAMNAYNMAYRIYGCYFGQSMGALDRKALQSSMHVTKQRLHETDVNIMQYLPPQIRTEAAQGMRTDMI
eukprot:1533482-Amphidinium_carterae.1